MTGDNAVARAWPDLAGRIVRYGDDIHHVLPVRVYFEDTDFSGVVYHASYVRWCERGRSDFLRLLGNSHQGLLDGENGQPAGAFVVRHMTLDFRKPARIDEVLEVVTRTKEVGAASLVLNQQIRRGDLTIFEADVTVVLVSIAGKPMRIAQALRQAIGI